MDLVRFTHPASSGRVVEYWNDEITVFCSIVLKNIRFHKINQPWIEKIIKVENELLKLLESRLIQIWRLCGFNQHSQHSIIP